MKTPLVDKTSSLPSSLATSSPSLPHQSHPTNFKIMDQKKINYPSFFKIMHGDFSTELRVPPAFEDYIRHKKKSREFTLSLKFGAVPSSWKVTVEKRRPHYYFTRGWSEMAKDLKLEKSNFLVFYLVAKDAFQVAIYDRTACAKTFNTLVTTLNEEVKEEEDGLKRRHSRRASFYVTLSHDKLYKCYLPINFASKTGLCKMEAVEIKDPAGRKWHIKLASSKANYKLPDTEDNRRYEMRSGWANFYQGNKLAAGDRLKFEHVGGCMMLVKKLKQHEIRVEG